MRAGVVRIVLVLGLLTAKVGAGQSYPVVGTGQMKCYDNRNEITPSKPGQPFYGQDAQHSGHQLSYKLSADGLTIVDNVTGLTWQRSPNISGDGQPTSRNKLTLAQAQQFPAKLNAMKFGGYGDWRLPSIKELYSLILFSGVDSGPGADYSRMRPFIDTKYFKFAYGDERSGERIIDSQWASNTKFVGKSFKGFEKLFGVNFADGRIKGYDLLMPGGGQEKRFYVICVRGNPDYGKNDFHENGDGTITDHATGLMWDRGDSAKGMNWESALAWVQAKNAERYHGHNDWRLPSAKELQSIVDYSRAPDVSDSPAIDPLFHCTGITNEIGKSDFPYYWTSTTHTSIMAGGNAVYIAFGRAAGWPTGIPGQGSGPGRGGPAHMGPYGPRPGGQGEPGMGGPPGMEHPNTGNVTYHYTDVHGAGAQRSDPKTGDPSKFPHGHGPQGDVIRIFNFVRCVRNAI